MKGYEVVYDHPIVKNAVVYAGNIMVFPCYRLAAQYRARCQKLPWIKETLYIRRVDCETDFSEAKYYGRKIVYPKDWILTMDSLVRGDYVSGEYVKGLMELDNNPEVRGGVYQITSEAVCRLNGNTLCDVFPTFAKVTDDVWEYKGKCTKKHIYIA